MTAATHTPASDLRRAQLDTAVTAAAASLVRVERGQLRLARCISEIAAAIGVVDRLLPSGLVVVLTSSQELVDHVAAWWNRAHPDAAYVLTGSRHGSSGLPHDALCTNSSDIIAAWVPAHTAQLRVVVGQHRHADLIGEGLLKASEWADLLIVHEAHHTAGRRTRREAIHDDKALPAAARLYTTAAPRIYRRADTPRPADLDEVALSMDEEDVFGPVLHHYLAEQAITDGLAPRFRLRIDTRPHPAPGHRPAPTTQAATNDDAAPQVVTPHIFCTHRDNRRTINVTFAEALTPGTPRLSGQDSPCCRDSTDDDVVIAVTHPGASNPHTTIAATITPAHAATDIGWVEVVRTHPGLRHILSALRDCDPAFGTALDAARAHGPDHHRDLGRWITIEPPASAPSSLNDDLLGALAHAGAHHWWVGYGHLAAHHARTGSAVVSHGHKVDGYALGQWYFATRSTYLRRGLALDRYNALHALSATIDDQRAVNRQHRWDLHMAEAEAFHARYHHLDVDLPSTEASSTFRIWLGKVRNGTWPVTEVERAALDTLGMIWDDAPLLRRKAIAAAFADYHARHGTLDFPDDLLVDVRGAPVRLISWVTVFRREHHLGTLHSDVRRTLQDAGFVFDPDAAWWEDLITTARRYHELHGDLDVAPGAFHTAAGECLFTVLQHCRTRWRQPLFDPDRAATLKTLDPLWGTFRPPSATKPRPARPQPPPAQPTEPPADRQSVPQPQPVPSANAAWNTGLQAAWRHRDQFGHLVPATDHRDPSTGLRLMAWLSRQRQARRNDRLTPDQIAALDTLDMIWDPDATSRSLGIQHARSYHAQHGHLRVPSTAPYHGTDTRGEPYNLYYALVRARQDHAKETLHEAWRQALDELGYDYAAEWSPLPDYVADLEAYHAEHGNLDVAPQHPAHTSLKRLNYARQRSALPEDLQQRLADIGYGHETPFTDWDDVFAVVQVFYNTHGHIDVPPDLRATRPDGDPGPVIRLWLNNQRRRLQVGATTQQQKENLDAVGFIWDLEESEWMEKYRLACRFQQEHGHLAITKPHVRDNPEWAPLPGWLRTQTKLRTAQHLKDERVTRLDLIGMPWVEQPGREHQWEHRLRQVEEFRRTHGHTRIHAQLNLTTDAGKNDELKKIAAWLNDQLVYAKRGTLRTDRRERLTAIGITVPTPAPRKPHQ